MRRKFLFSFPFFVLLLLLMFRFSQKNKFSHLFIPKIGTQRLSFSVKYNNLSLILILNLQYNFQIQKYYILKYKN